MTSRRRFLGITGLGAATLAAPWSSALAQSEPKPKAKRDPKAKPEGVVVNDIHAQLNSTLVWKIEQPDSLEGVRAAFQLARKEKRALCVAGGRHAMGTQQFGLDGVLIDTRKLTRIIDFDAERGLIEVEAGLQWPRLHEFLVAGQRGRDKQWAFAQKPAGVDRTTVGGCLSSNVHGMGLAMAPLAADIEAFKLVDARGELLRCTRADNPELFRLAIGGYGLFGFVYSVTLRLAPRRKLERVVEPRSIEGLGGAFADRFRDGFLYGEFHCSIDDKSPEFLRQGVLVSYRAVPADTPVLSGSLAPTEKEWIDYLEFAHSNKPASFKRMVDSWQTRNGTIEWSDDLQMSPYPDNYHREIDRRLQAPRGTEVMTEVCCEAAGLERFMAEVRAFALREQVEIIQASVRAVEEDKDSFLAWARKPYLVVALNIHVEHTTRGLIRAGDAFRRLIDTGLRYGGSWYPTYHRHALRRQVDVAFPQFGDFLKAKHKYDAGELFQSDWYKHYKNMFSR